MSKWRGGSKEIYLTLIVTRDHVCKICGRSIEQEIIEWEIWCREVRLRQKPTRKRGEIDLNLDHIVPRSRGGSDDLENLMLVHRQCNLMKGDLTLAEYLSGEREHRYLRAQRSQRQHKKRKSSSIKKQRKQKLDRVKWKSVNPYLDDLYIMDI